MYPDKPSKNQVASKEPNVHPKSVPKLSNQYLLPITANTLAPNADRIGNQAGQSSAITTHGILTLKIGKLPTATMVFWGKLKGTSLETSGPLGPSLITLVSLAPPRALPKASIGGKNSIRLMPSLITFFPPYPS
jgi:hypothetical protein